LWVLDLPFLIWLRFAALTARHAGYPARRSPNWAVWGYIVPVVSLWFPYLSAVDCFAPGDPRRKIAGHWWGWALAQEFVGGVVLLVALAGRGPALVIATIGLICPVLATWYGLELVRAVSAAHEELARQ
jgi:hypothetical protein